MTGSRSADPFLTRQEWENLLVNVSDYGKSILRIVEWQKARDDETRWLWRAVLGAFIASIMGTGATLTLSILGWLIAITIGPANLGHTLISMIFK